MASALDCADFIPPGVPLAQLPATELLYVHPELRIDVKHRSPTTEERTMTTQLEVDLESFAAARSGRPVVTGARSS